MVNEKPESPWWRHQMEIFSALLAICPRWIPPTKPVTRSFDVFFDLRLKIRLSKQSWGWWFETSSCLLWRHSNAMSATRFFFCRARILTVITLVHIIAIVPVNKHAIRRQRHPFSYKPSSKLTPFDQTSMNGEYKFKYFLWSCALIYHTNYHAWYKHGFVNHCDRCWIYIFRD